jgi:nicotinamidase-related amidase
MKLKLELKYTTKPTEIEFAPEKTALVIVDMQNDFCSKGGMADIMGADYNRLRSPTTPIKKVAEAARKSGIKIIYICCGFRPDMADAAPIFLELHKRSHAPLGTKAGPPGEKNVGIWIKDTWNTEVVKEIAPQQDDIIIWKRTYGAFQDTDMELILRNLKIDTLIFTGIATHMCLESTLREAVMKGFRVAMLKDCTATFDDELQRNSERIIEFWFGYISTAEHFLKSVTAK